MDWDYTSALIQRTIQKVRLKKNMFIQKKNNIYREYKPFK